MRTSMDDNTAVMDVNVPSLSSSRIHLIGVGGSGMNAAASLLTTMGADVSGSDQIPFEGLGPLVAGGARITVGHDPSRIADDVDLVVVSAAIPNSNPELLAARSRGLKVIKYAELVGRLMGCFEKGVAIAGTHGKSSTTAMCAHLCREAGLDPAFLIGACSKQLGGQSANGSGRQFIVEACEFDRSFLELAPESGAILNVDNDHLDYYRDMEDIADAFGSFASKISPDGLLVYPLNDRWATEASRSSRAAVQTFGFDMDADWRALNLRADRGCYSFGVQFRGSPVISTRLSVPGQYNVANALAAIALAYHCGATFDSISAALPTFEGIQRRMTWRGEGRGVTIVDDYAHHPTEIKVTIEAARHRYSPKRTWVVFQPHQHSRTMRLMQDFAVSFSEADEIIIPEVYDARAASDDADRDGAEELVRQICHTGTHARYLPSLDAAAEHVIERVEEGDLVMTMGAGDVWKVADELVARICKPDRA